MRSILLVDDNEALLNGLADRLRGILLSEADVRTWVPTAGSANPQVLFDGLVDNETVIVVTDYDLTGSGQTGLFGTSIVSWCQARALPVGDFSRGGGAGLPKAPELFEFRVPTDPDAASIYIAALFRGFVQIEAALDSNDTFLSLRSPAAVLAGVLGEQAEESQFALYVKFGTTSGALLDTVTADPAIEPDKAQKVRLLTYIVGHLLLNAVLRFPGPIISREALRAYLATSDTGDDVLAIFSDATYVGPFWELDRYFWLSKVDLVLDSLITDLPATTETETPGEMNRLAVERRLGRVLARHSCPRCHGVNGGFFCPLTRKTVCQLKTCSTGANSWIPAGARLCRIEREFFDEWEPILGL